MATLLHDALAKHADDGAAIGAPDRVIMTFGELRTLTVETRVKLNALGIGRNDRVAIVLPNGP